MIDPATGWFEVKSLDKEPDSDIVSAAMDDTWFCRYPRPQIIGYDNGSEFKSVFETMIKNYGLESKGSVPYNPQSHGVIERIHQVLEDALRTFELEEQDLKGKDPFGPYLAAAAFAIRSSYHTTLGATPAQLVFGRDMILPVRFKANWEIIQARRQKEIDKNNARENSKRIDHTYKVGDKVCKRRPGKLPKLRRKRDGPYEVTAVYNNGNVEILRGAVSERINIRRLNPYHES
jgi:transposase InsO family protein